METMIWIILTGIIAGCLGILCGVGMSARAVTPMPNRTAPLQISPLIPPEPRSLPLPKIFPRLDWAVHNAVRHIQQTVVDRIKRVREDGTGRSVITKQEGFRIRAQAVESAKMFLGAQGVAELLTVLGVSLEELDVLVAARVESALQELHARKSV